MVETTLEIRFPADDRAAVLIRPGASGTAEAQAEIVLLCLYTARVLANLRQTEGARVLAESLTTFAYASTDELVAFLEGEGPPIAGGRRLRVALLAPTEASSRDRTFEASASFPDGEPNPRVVFAMRPRRFGLFGKGVEYYAPRSVLALLYALPKRRAGDLPYLHRLARAAGSVGRLATTDPYALEDGTDVAIVAADIGWQAVAHPAGNGAQTSVVECPSCGNAGTLSARDPQFEYRLWPSDAEAIRRCRRCRAGVWVQEGGVRMISSARWDTIEALRQALLAGDGGPALAAAAEPAAAAAEGPLLGSLKRVFVESRWPFSEVPGMPVLLSQLSGPPGSWTFYAQVVEDRGLIAFYSVCPLAVPEDRRREVAEFLTRVNYGLASGNFELDFADGEIRYKTVLDAQGADVGPELVKRLVRANGLAMETYLPGIEAVVAGTAPIAALEALATA